MNHLTSQFRILLEIIWPSLQVWLVAHGDGWSNCTFTCIWNSGVRKKKSSSFPVYTLGSSRILVTVMTKPLCLFFPNSEDIASYRRLRSPISSLEIQALPSFLAMKTVSQS